MLVVALIFRSLMKETSQATGLIYPFLVEEKLNVPLLHTWLLQRQISDNMQGINLSAELCPLVNHLVFLGSDQSLQVYRRQPLAVIAL